MEHFFKTQIEPLHDSQSPYSEPDDYDSDKSTECSTSGESSEIGGQFHHSRQQEENPQDELNSQFARTHDSSNLGGGSAEEERIFQTVKSILNNRTPKKFDLLKDQLMDSGITSAIILVGVTSLIYEKAVAEPAFCHKLALLLSDLSQMLPRFPSGDGQISCKRVLLNLCQETFESSDKLREEVEQMTAPEQKTERRVRERRVKLRTLGNIRLIGELLKQNMLTEIIIHRVIKVLLERCDSKPCPTEENVEAICQLLNTAGEKLDERPISRPINDIYYTRLNDMSTNPQLAPRLRSMVRDVLDLRANNWVPKREECSEEDTFDAFVSPVGEDEGDTSVLPVDEDEGISSLNQVNNLPSTQHDALASFPSSPNVLVASSSPSHAYSALTHSLSPVLIGGTTSLPRSSSPSLDDNSTTEGLFGGLFGDLGSLVKLRGEILLDSVSADLLETVFAKYPSLWEDQLHRSLRWRQLVFANLGDVLRFMKFIPLSEFVGQNLKKLKSSWTELQLVGLDLSWLAPFVNRALGVQSVVDAKERVAQLESNLESHRLRMKELSEEKIHLKSKLVEIRQRLAEVDSDESTILTQVKLSEEELQRALDVANADISSPVGFTM